MAEYIDREAYLERMKKTDMYFADIDRPTKSQFKRMAAQMDYAPVVHGKWIATHDDFCSCSLCMYPIAVWRQKNYCPNCGARMME